MPRHIDQMVVIITGASSGIGLALAEELSNKGAKLVLAARRLPKLEEVNAKLGGQHLPVACDVADPAQCEQLITKAVEHFGGIDTMVCNAGYGLVRTVTETTSQEMRDMFATNVFGSIDCARAAAAVMAKQNITDGYRGQIMIVSSAAGRRGLPYFGCYAATKFAQLGFSESMRVELHD
jgi:NAD(P)-dependent dehydrogenase (short-subunit alcohol dehydrogenase family)